MTPTNAVDERIALNLLIEWENNPRKTRDDNDVAQMAKNTLTLGQQAPLIVFKGPGETLYKVIEGETRRRGFNLNATAAKIAIDCEIRCWVLPEDTTNEQLLAVAVAANTVRTMMNPIEEMEAYSSMARAGIKIRAIAETFAIDKKVVEQRLALGDLVASARELVRNGSRQMGWAQAMTLGSPLAQERIVAEIQVNDNAFTDGASVRAEMNRGSIPVASALFDPNELSEFLVRDLFMPNGNYFSDPDQFWTRQRVEIQKKLDELETTHKSVKFVDRMRFDDAGWTTGGEPLESTAVLIAHDDGSIDIRECMIPPVADEDDASDGEAEGGFLADADDHYGSEHEANPDAAIAPSRTNILAGGDTGQNEGDEQETVQAVVVNPLDNATKDTMVYLSSQVSAALKLAVSSDTRFAMATVVAASLTRRGPSSTLSVAGVPLDTKDQTAQVFSQLQAKRTARDRIATDAGIAGMNSPADVIRKLLALEAGLLEQFFAYTVADSILVDISEATVDIFDALGADIFAGWRIEENYLKTLNNAQIRTLAMEVIDLDNLPRPRAPRSQVEHAILESVEAGALQGDFMGGLPAWIPPQIAILIDEAAAAKHDATGVNADTSDADVAQAA